MSAVSCILASLSFLRDYRQTSSLSEAWVLQHFVLGLVRSTELLSPVPGNLTATFSMPPQRVRTSGYILNHRGIMGHSHAELLPRPYI